MAQYQLLSGIGVDTRLRRFVEDEALLGTRIDAGVFWPGFSALLRELTPENRRLRPLTPDRIAFQAASALIFEGERHPSGYTEPLLHAHRLRLKEAAG